MKCPNCDTETDHVIFYDGSKDEINMAINCPKKDSCGIVYAGRLTRLPAEKAERFINLKEALTNGIEKGTDRGIEDQN